MICPMTEPVTLLGGKVIADQSEAGFRSGLDAVLLGASIDIGPDETGLEFGCGSGAAMLVAAFHNPDSRFQGFDTDAAVLAIAGTNIAANGWPDRVAVFRANVSNPGELGPVPQVFFNPPYYDDPKKLVAPDARKQAAYIGHGVPLQDWIKLAHTVLIPKGRVTLIHRADRLDDILMLLKKGFGDIAVKPVAPYADQPAKRVLVSARKGVKGPLKILPPLVLHDGSDRKYTPEAEAILRGAERIVVR